MERKQLKFTKTTFEWLSDEANEANRSISRGVLLYEAVMMSTGDLTDEITEKERRVNEKLRTHTDTYFVNVVDRIKVRNQDGSFPSQQLIYGCDELTESLINIYLPVSVQEYLTEEWGQRYWAEKVDDLVADYVDSAFQSRYDRYKCKEDLIRYLEDDVEPEHEVAKCIVDEDVESRFDVADARNHLEGMWWLNDDLGYEEYTKMVEDRVDSKTSKQVKIDVATGLIRRFEEDRKVTADSVLAVDLITKFMNVSEDYVRNEYLPEIDLDEEVEDGESVDDLPCYYDLCEEAKGNLIEFLEDENQGSKAERINRMNAPNVCLFEKSDIEELDELEDQKIRNGKIKQIIEKGSYSRAFEINQQSQVHQDMIEKFEQELQ